MRRFAVLFTLALAGIGVAAPSAERPASNVAPRVSVSGIFVGGLTSEEARARLRWAFGRNVHFSLGARRWWVKPSFFGVETAVDAAVTEALRAKPGSRLRLPMRIGSKRIDDYVKALDQQYSRAPQDAHAYLAGLAPAIAPSKPGLRVDTKTTAAGIKRALSFGFRRQVRVIVRSVAADVTSTNFGSIIVIRRGSNGLYLYNGAQLVRSFQVATGRAQYPTPLGTYSIVDKQRQPWWRPPDSAWAKGLKPIPPGPGNPLGTRWMGTSASGVGIHGTPDAASIGYSASHGCVRMFVPDAEWLFEHVSIGTPVFIVSA
ncbi:MAG: L,D-transpeptidase/peptidoglycan binding protein [Actinomycetota bacterium]|nr:L,D-transpeptidase/peptidoglycan binding protein [Actinomycetota bacterium]